MVVSNAAKELEKKGIDVVRFSLGEPDFKSPSVVKKACIAAIKHDHTKYEHSQGMIELRAAIARHYKKKYGVKIDPEQVLVTPGTSQALFLTFSVLLKNGGAVILPNPHYPSDSTFVKFAGGDIVYHPVYEKDGFHWDVTRLKKQITKNVKAILVTSPANPTGAALSDDEYKFMARTGKYIVSDELYHGLTYDGAERSALEFTDKAFVINGFSKAYAMTGYRLGYVIAPKKFVKDMQLIQQNFYISVTSFVQIAGIAALDHAQADVKRMREDYQKRRDVMITGLNKIGLKVNYRPEGAFYVLVNCRHIDRDSKRLAMRLLNEAHVAVTPGIDFGSETEGYLRFSYATSPKRIKEGLRRIANFLKRERS